MEKANSLLFSLYKSNMSPYFPMIFPKKDTLIKRRILAYATHE